MSRREKLYKLLYNTRGKINRLCARNEDSKRSSISLDSSSIPRWSNFSILSRLGHLHWPFQFQDRDSYFHVDERTGDSRCKIDFLVVIPTWKIGIWYIYPLLSSLQARGIFSLFPWEELLLILRVDPFEIVIMKNSNRLQKTFAKILIPPASEYDILDIWRMTQRDIVSNTFDYFRPVSTSTWYLAAKRVKKLLENCCNRIGWPTITRKLWIPRYRLLQPYKLSPIELFFRSSLEFRGRHRNEIKLTATRLTFHITFIVLAKEEGRVSRIRWKYVQPSLCRIPHWMSPRCKL